MYPISFQKFRPFKESKNWRERRIIWMMIIRHIIIDKSVFDVPPLFVLCDVLIQRLSLFLVQLYDSSYYLKKSHCLIKTSWCLSFDVPSYHILQVFPLYLFFIAFSFLQLWLFFFIHQYLFFLYPIRFTIHMIVLDFRLMIMKNNVLKLI